MSATTATAAIPIGAPVDLQHGGYTGEEWLIVCTIPASTPANTQIAATASRGAGAAQLSTLQGPGDEYWSVETIYTFGSVPSPDVQLIINVNGSNQPFTVLFSSVLQTNFARPGLQYAWTLNPSSTLSFAMNPIGTVSGSMTVYFRLKIGRFKM
jgi:hypothetical protein